MEASTPWHSQVEEQIRDISADTFLQDTLDCYVIDILQIETFPVLAVLG